MRRALPLAALLAILACHEPRTSRAPVPSAPPAPDGPFASQEELLDAIEQGTFAQEMDLEDEFPLLAVPAPGEIDFSRGGTRVPDDQQDALELLAGQLAADDRLQVDLIGCSDPSGSADLNLRISRKRAEAVASRLAELGVAGDQIGEVEGRGESCEQQRRVVRMVPKLREQTASREDT